MTRAPRVLIGYSCCPLTLEAFERAGCEAWTCDLLPSRGRPDRHLQCDIWEVAGQDWDFGLFHPMCTYLTVSAAWAFGDGPYHQKVKAGTLVGAARRGVPALQETHRVAGRIVGGRERWANQTDSGQNRLTPGEGRWLERSATYPGIAAAMGQQWGSYLLAGGLL